MHYPPLSSTLSKSLCFLGLLNVKKKITLTIKVLLVDPLKATYFNQPQDVGISKTALLEHLREHNTYWYRALSFPDNQNLLCIAGPISLSGIFMQLYALRFLIIEFLAKEQLEVYFVSSVPFRMWSLWQLIFQLYFYCLEFPLASHIP